MYIHTFFTGTMLKCNQVLLLGKLWLDRVNVSSAITLTGHSPNVIVAFWKHFRKLVSSTLEPEDQNIGGHNVIV
jgi:hypothetical protein